MKIYDAEKKDNLQEIIAANASITYASEAYHIIFDTNDNELKKIVAAAMKLNAGAHDSDLYFVKSILVSSCWNKNDDVFDKAEIWQARYTPVDKPANLDHDEHKLVGHINACWAVDSKGNLIPENTPSEQLPNYYHLFNTSVVYKQWSDQALKNQAKELIEKIESGEKYVSMECLFSGFDYAIAAEKGYEVQQRNEDSAFLTKYLRAYGGVGEYEGKKIGRLLRDVLFCGKGFVDRPANPDSIIFNANNSEIFVTSVYDNNTSESVICDVEPSLITIAHNTEVLEKEAIMPDDRLKELEAENADLRKQLQEVDKASFEQKIEELETKVQSLQTTIETKDKQIGALEAAAQEVKTAVAKLEEDKDSLQKQLNEASMREIVAKRVAMLVDGGIKKEIAETQVTKFESLTDEQFSIVAEALIHAVPTEPAQSDEVDDEQDENEAQADVSLNTAETDKEAVDLAADDTSEVDEMQVIRSDLQKLIASRLGQKVEE